jgi:hypothetical protein
MVCTVIMLSVHLADTNSREVLANASQPKASMLPLTTVTSQISQMTTATGTRALATTPIFGQRKNTLKLPRQFRKFAKTRRMFRSFCGLVKRLLGHYITALK